MRVEGLGFQFGMELHADEPRVLGDFDDLGSRPSGDRPENKSPFFFQPLDVGGVYFVAVAVALGDQVLR